MGGGIVQLMEPKKPTFYFIGKLSDKTALYQVQDQDLGKGFNLAIFLDGIAITTTSNLDVKKLLDDVRTIIDTIVSAFVFKTNKPLSYTLDNWIEAKQGSPEQSIIGWILPKHSDIKARTQKSTINTSWKKAIFFHKNLETLGNNNHRLAIKDYRQALTDTSTDSFLFAYRALEDICRACTGKRSAQQGWDEMHRILGTNKSQIQELTKVSKAVRHGDVNNTLVLSTYPKRTELLDGVHAILMKEFGRSFKKF